jgi:hypothetical protein
MEYVHSKIATISVDPVTAGTGVFVSISVTGGSAYASLTIAETRQLAANLLAAADARAAAHPEE